MLEVKGFRDEADKAKAETARDLWVPGVNALGGFGHWGFAELRDPWITEQAVTALIEQLLASPSPAWGGWRKAPGGG